MPRVIPGHASLADELADLAAERPPSSSKTSMSCPSAGKPSEHGFVGAMQRDREEARADLGAAGDVHDRDPPAAADVLVQPVVRAAVPRLAGRRHRAERGQVGRRLALAGSAPARASARRRASSPAPTRRALQIRSGGPVRRALHEDDRRAERTGPDDGPRPHDPAHVGREEDAVARLAGRPGRRPRGRSRAGSRPGRGARPSAARSSPRCTRGGTAPRSSTSAGGSSPGVLGDELVPVVVAARASSARRRPSRRQTTTCSTDGASASASSAISFIGTAAPRRSVAVGGHEHLRPRVRAAARRSPAPRSPEKIGTWIAPMCAHACEAIAASGAIGR